MHGPLNVKFKISHLLREKRNLTSPEYIYFDVDIYKAYFWFLTLECHLICLTYIQDAD